MATYCNLVVVGFEGIKIVQATAPLWSTHQTHSSRADSAELHTRAVRLFVTMEEGSKKYRAHQVLSSVLQKHGASTETNTVHRSVSVAAAHFRNVFDTVNEVVDFLSSVCNTSDKNDGLRLGLDVAWCSHHCNLSESYGGSFDVRSVFNRGPIWCTDCLGHARPSTADVRHMCAHTLAVLTPARSCETRLAEGLLVEDSCWSTSRDFTLWMVSHDLLHLYTQAPGDKIVQLERLGFVMSKNLALMTFGARWWFNLRVMDAVDSIVSYLSLPVMSARHESETKSPLLDGCARIPFRASDTRCSMGEQKMDADDGKQAASRRPYKMTLLLPLKIDKNQLAKWLDVTKGLGIEFDSFVQGDERDSDVDVLLSRVQQAQQSREQDDKLAALNRQDIERRQTAESKRFSAMRASLDSKQTFGLGPQHVRDVTDLDILCRFSRVASIAFFTRLGRHIEFVCAAAKEGVPSVLVNAPPTKT